MVSAPSYYLHLSCVVHVVGFVLLVVGYSTPYWTTVSMTTGEVRFLGLVVSCLKTPCQLLHVTEARDVAVIVFGMSTANILIGLFIVQLFCLSLCNGSCRSKNMGIGLSYLCFLVALFVAVTLVLYQIDLQEDKTPDVTSMQIGWSRYTVIVSSVMFSVAASLSIADYVTRNNNPQLEIGKKWGTRKKVIEIVNENRTASANAHAADDTLCTNVDELTYGGNSQTKRTIKTVDITMKTDLSKQGMKNSANQYPNNHSNSRATTSVIMVNQNARDRRECIAAGESCHKQNASQTTEPRDREGLAIVANALKKYTLTKHGKSECMGERHCLPSVEEETMNYDTCKTGQNRKNLTRQMALTADSCDFSDSSNSVFVVDGKERNCDRISSNDDAVRGPSKRHVGITETPDRPFDPVSRWGDENGKGDLSRSTTSTISLRRNGRRSSVVEDALLSVSNLLDRTVSGGQPAAELGYDPSMRRQLPQTGSNKNDLEHPGAVQVKSRNTDLGEKCGQSRDNVSSGDETYNVSGTKMVADKGKTARRWSQFQDHMSEDHLKRNMIVECLSRDLGRRRKQITQ